MTDFNNRPGPGEGGERARANGVGEEEEEEEVELHTHTHARLIPCRNAIKRPSLRSHFQNALINQWHSCHWY